MIWLFILKLLVRGAKTGCGGDGRGLAAAWGPAACLSQTGGYREQFSGLGHQVTVKTAVHVFDQHKSLGFKLLGSAEHFCAGHLHSPRR